MIGNWIIAIVGYGTALSFAAAAAAGCIGSFATKPGSRPERFALIWWLCGALLSLLFAVATRDILGTCRL